MPQSILVARQGAIATITLNRPEKRNALDAAAWTALGEAVEGLSHDDGLRCIVLRGAGPDAFAAGADISGFEEEHSTIELAKAYKARTDHAVAAIAQGRHPVVAMIHGYCLGGGFEIAAACDIRIARGVEPARRPGPADGSLPGLRAARYAGPCRRPGNGVGDRARRPDLHRPRGLREGDDKPRRTRGGAGGGSLCLGAPDRRGCAAGRPLAPPGDPSIRFAGAAERRRDRGVPTPMPTPRTTTRDTGPSWPRKSRSSGGDRRWARRRPARSPGLKIIECAQVVAGPTCGYMLADLGAEVIKVERAPLGDDVRRMAPPTIGGESAAFMMLNRNKRAIVLDLKQDAGKEAFRRLVRGADVVVENYRMGAMDRLGLGYDRLREENPALIYAAISGFGRTGPYAHRGGYDLVAQAMSGLMSITGEAPGRPPVKIGSPIADFAAGVLAALGIAARLRASAQDRPGAISGHLVVRGRDFGDVPPGGDVSGHGRAAGSPGLCPSVERALPGLRNRRWLDHRGRRQPGQLVAACRRAWRTGACGGSAVCDQRPADGEPGCVEPRASTPCSSCTRPRRSWTLWKRPACPPGRCSTSAR